MWKAGVGSMSAFLFAGVGLLAVCFIACLIMVSSAQAETSFASPLYPAKPASAGTLKLTLKDCINISLERNLGIKNQEDSVAIADSALLIEADMFLPSLEATYLVSIYNSHLVQDYGNNAGLAFSLKHKYGGEFGVAGGLGWTEHTSDYRDDIYSSYYSGAGKSEFGTSLGFSLSQQLLRGAGQEIATAGLRQAGLGVETAKLDLEESILDLSLSVKQAFYALLRAEEHVKVMQSSLAASKIDLSIAELRLTEGLSSRLEHSRAELQFINRQRYLSNSRKDVDSRIDALVSLIGLDVGARIEPLFDRRRKPLSREPQEYVEIAFRERPDMRAMRVTLRRYKLYEKTAKDSTLPSLAAEGKFTMKETDDKFHESLDITERVWEFALSFEHDFLDRTSGESYIQSRIASRQLGRSLEDLKRQVELSIREIVRNLKMLSDEVAYLERAEGVASEQLELARLNYREGLITNKDLIAAENDHIAAQIEHINATYDYLSALAQLEHAMGGKSCR
ncbi:TolC family protein [bacterium]|nr:TolC family protein [bacterium]